MAKSKFFRIAVQGATATDGRTVERQWILDAVKNFNRETYGVRVNCEHLRGLAPDSAFGAYGDVLAVKSEEVDLEIGGKTEKRLALLAQIDPTDDLVALNKRRQKIYSSCEFAPNFGGTKLFGLVGVAVTDNPASLGTEALQFTALKPMFDARKTAPENMFTASEEVTLELEAAAADDGRSLTDTIQAAFASVAARFTTKGEEKPPEEEKPKHANDNDFAKFATALGQQVAATIGAVLKPVVDAQAAGDARTAAIEAKLSTTEAPQQLSRLPATGGANSIVTDC